MLQQLFLTAEKLISDPKAEKSNPLNMTLTKVHILNDLLRQFSMKSPADPDQQVVCVSFGFISGSSHKQSHRLPASIRDDREDGDTLLCR